MPAISDVSQWDSDAMREAGDNEFVHRREHVGKYRNYYDGVYPKPLVDDKDNVIINLCKQVVDETAAFLAPDMPVLELDEDGDVSDNERLLAEVWANSGGARLLNQMAVSGGYAGHIFARVVVDEGGMIRIVNLNPANVIRWWLSSDHSVTMGYEIRWRVGKMEFRIDVIRMDAGWLVRELYREWKGDGQHSSKPVWVMVKEYGWDYAIAPVIDWQHLPRIGEAYGENEIPHAQMNLHVNKIASDIKSILRYHAYPTTVGTGFSASEVQETRIDGFLTIADKEAKVYNVEMQSDLVSSMNMLQTMRDAFFNQARVVVVKGGLDTFRGMTNLGIRAAFMPMIAKTAQLRRNYTDGIVAISRLVMALNGVAGAEDMPIKVMWGEALPVDMREELSLIQQMMALGLMSKETAAGRLGLDWNKEVSNMQSEAVMENAMINGIGDNVG